MIEDHDGDFKKKSENAGNHSNASDEKSEQKEENQEIDKTRVIPPKLPREFMHIVRPAYFVKENSNGWFRIPYFPTDFHPRYASW